MRIMPILVPYVIRKWQEDPKQNPEGASLEEMLQMHQSQLRALDLPDHMVESLEAGAIELMKKDQVAAGRQHEVA